MVLITFEEEMWSETKLWNDPDSWSNAKIKVDTMTVFDNRRKNIYTHSMQRELKELGLNSCVALRKPLVSKANWAGEGELHFAEEHKD